MKLNANLILITFTYFLSGCVTSTIENARNEITDSYDGEAVVVMAKSYHQGNETEADYINCIERSLGNGRGALNVLPTQKFIDNAPCP